MDLNMRKCPHKNSNKCLGILSRLLRQSNSKIKKMKERNFLIKIHKILKKLKIRHYKKKKNQGKSKCKI